jgi:hypothetical protein
MNKLPKETKKQRKARVGMNYATKLNYNNRKDDNFPVYFGGTCTPYVNPLNFD